MILILACVEYDHELTVVVARVTVDNWDLSPHSARKVRIKALMKTALIKIVLITLSYTYVAILSNIGGAALDCIISSLVDTHLV